MKRLLIISAFLYLPALAFAQKMSADHYWISLKDKEYNEYSINDPSEFLGPKAISRRERFNIPVTVEDLPVSRLYSDSLASLGLKILGSSKWFNAMLVQSNDTALLDTLNRIEFINDFSPAIESFSTSHNESVESDELEFNLEIEYGESYLQSNLLGGLGLHKLGYKGQGIDIAVLDAGFYMVDSFEVFRQLWDNGQIIHTHDYVNPEGDLFDESSHGMSVLSTIAVDEPGLFIGTAPEAGFYLLRTEDAPRENKVEEAYWVFGAEFADSAGADIITTSLGYHSFDSTAMNYDWEDLDGNSALVTRAAEFAFSRGMIVVASAGNEGSSRWLKVTPPADGPNVLAVGSIDTAMVVSRFSSRGNTEDGRIKPDILAVGFETRLINRSGQTGYGFGTSFAAPQIAGLAACLWQAMPEKTNAEIIQAIRHSANFYANPDSIHGYGVPNFMVALWFLNAIENSSYSDEIKIYPQPFEQEFFIMSNENINSISIYSLSGSLEFSVTGNWQKGEIISVNPSRITQAGIYFLVTKNDQKEFVSKLIRK